jgi:predicted RNase H-like nuclease (RuvC/YqgF family)
MELCTGSRLFSDHEEICFEGSECPLCKMLETIKEKEEEIETLEEKVKDLDSAIEDLKDELHEATNTKE